MIELHIQIDLDRDDEQIATVVNKKDTTLNEVNNLIGEIERAKDHLLSLDFDDDDIDSERLD